MLRERLREPAEVVAEERLARLEHHLDAFGVSGLRDEGVSRQQRGVELELDREMVVHLMVAFLLRELERVGAIEAREVGEVIALRHAGGAPVLRLVERQPAGAYLEVREEARLQRREAFLRRRAIEERLRPRRRPQVEQGPEALVK